MDKEKIFKVFMNYTANAAITFYRMINFAKYMRKQKNTQVAYNDFNANSNKTVAWEEELEEGGDKLNQIVHDMDMLHEISDIAIWQMSHTMISYSLFMAYREKNHLKKPLLLEIDDDAFNLNPENTAFESYNPNSNLEYFAEMQIRNANAVIVSTEYLKSMYSKYNENIVVIPNAIDFEKWDRVKNRKTKDIVRIGWAGGQAHAKDLNIIARIIPEILSKYPHVEFVFLGACSESIPLGDRVKHIEKWYNIEQYPTELGKLGLDIGIAPLRDNYFNRAKSNLKYLEYSALKIPTVASPVEPYGSIPLCLAYDSGGWITILSDLIENKTKRESFGLTAYNYVKKNYNAETIAGNYLKVLKEFVNKERPMNNGIYDDKLKKMIYKFKT